MALTITSITPEKILAEGGVPFSLVGDFSGKLGTGFRVYVGQAGNNTDAPCYSGVVGQGTLIYPVSETELRAYFPELTPDTHNVFVEWAPLTSENGLLAAALEVLPKQYYSRVFELRSVFPRFYRMGPRNMEGLEPLP